MKNVEAARDLARKGRVAEAVATLEAQGQEGSAASFIELALWYLSGSPVERDLTRTRAYFGRAAELGDAQARYIYLSLLANGTGGAQDWPEAMRLLAALAATDRAAAEELTILTGMHLDECGNTVATPETETLSHRPEVRVFRGLLSPQECAYLIARAAPRMAPSTVVDSKTGQTLKNPVRTSDAMGFPWIQESPFIHAINRRLAAASGLGVECGEPLQVLRYRPGQEYRPHHDGLPGEDNQRVMTALVYLNEGYEGGETKFLHSSLAFKGDVGDALLFRNATDDGRPDPESLHAGLPVTSGEKLLASRWIRQKPFGPRT
jgi:prolyl 4-hydroxylase